MALNTTKEGFSVNEIKIAKAPQSYLSKVWKYFRFKDGSAKEMTVCKFCRVEVPYKPANTSDLQKHLDQKHQLELDFPEGNNVTETKGHRKLSAVLGQKLSGHSVRSKASTHTI